MAGAANPEPPSPNPRQAASDHLRHAQALHSEGRIEAALAEARQAVERDAGYVEAWTYLGTTLVTRRLAYEEGLRSLEHALELTPDDAGVNYSLGWCYEFVAYRLEKQATQPYRDPLDLYRLAAQRLQRCIDLDPEPGLREDAEDLLASIEARLDA
jgi:tetratricopeptide (TPR) repeat protein